MCDMFRDLKVGNVNLVMILIAIKDIQVFTSEALLVLTIQKSIHSKVGRIDKRQGMLGNGSPSVITIFFIPALLVGILHG